MSGQLLNPPAPPEQRKTVFDPRTIMLGLTGYAIQVGEHDARLVRLHEDGKTILTEVDAKTTETFAILLSDSSFKMRLQSRRMFARSVCVSRYRAWLSHVSMASWMTAEWSLRVVPSSRISK